MDLLLLSPAELHSDPISQFAAWLAAASRAGGGQPLAASLATAGSDGRPLARMVLLKFFDPRGFVFFTHLGSRKARQMAENPWVSLLFPWLAQDRQVNVTGRADRLDAVEAVRCFQLGQGGGVTALAAVEMPLAELQQRLGVGVPPTDAVWAGYRIVPDSVELYQGHGGREHQRFLYTRDPVGGWRIDTLE